jgi:uncharacterized membrane protein (UPF0127 family)
MKMWKITVVFLVLLLAGCASDNAEKKASSGTSDLRTVTIDASGGKKVEVRVEMADDPFERARGLMYRTALGEDRGMLFVFQKDQPLSFWMKNTRIPLSIAYIDSEGRITDLLDMKPLDDKPPHYVSSEPVRYALEVNQGFFDENGVEVGDHAELPR